jgi:hypothetical protein
MAQMKKLLVALFACIASIAVAQDGPNHSIPIFGGPGFVGFRSAGPCSAGQVLSWASLVVDPSCTPSGGTSTVSVNVMNFGCVGNGIADDRACIQAAIDALPVAGGNVTFPGNKTYCINSSLNIGDSGVSTAQSTRKGVVLIGEGNPTSSTFYGGYSDNAAPKIKYCGSSSGAAMLNILGPLQGWGIQNLYFECNSLIDIGLKVLSAMHGDVRNVSLANCRSNGLLSDAVANNVIGDTNSESNNYYNLKIFVPDITNANGMTIDGGTVAFPTDTDFNLFSDLNILLPLTATTTTGMRLKNADSNTFVNTIIFGGGAGATSLRLDYTGVTADHPNANVFLNFDPGTLAAVKVANDGTPGAGAASNTIYGYNTTNTGTIPNLPNLSIYHGNQITFSPGGNTFNTTIIPTLATVSNKTFNLPNASGTGVVSAAGLTTAGLTYATTTAFTIATDRCTMDSNQTIACSSAANSQPQYRVTNTTSDASSGSFTFLKNRTGGNTIAFDMLGALGAQGFANGSQQLTASINLQQVAASSGNNIPSRIELSTSNTAGQLNQQLTFDQNAHLGITAQATAPTITAGCNGAGAVVGTGSTDTHGTITGQTAAAATCTITFGTAYANVPHCVASGQTSPLTGAFTPSTTTLVVNFASTANYKWSYICMGS